MTGLNPASVNENRFKASLRVNMLNGKRIFAGLVPRVPQCAVLKSSRCSLKARTKISAKLVILPNICAFVTISGRLRDSQEGRTQAIC